MHQYLKAIGFDNINTKNNLKKLLKTIQKEFTHQTIISYRPGEDFCEMRKEYGQCIGISLCGELDEQENFPKALREKENLSPVEEGTGNSGIVQRS